MPSLTRPTSDNIRFSGRPAGRVVGSTNEPSARRAAKRRLLIVIRNPYDSSSFVMFPSLGHPPTADAVRALFIQHRGLDPETGDDWAARPFASLVEAVDAGGTVAHA